MTQTLRAPAVLLFGVVLAASAPTVAQRGAKPAAAAGNAAEATARIVAAAQALVSTLDEAGRAKVQFPFEGDAEDTVVQPPDRNLQAGGAADGGSRRRRSVLR